MNTHQFLQELYPDKPPDLHILVWRNKQSFWFQDIQEAAIQIQNHPDDAYYGVGLSPENFGKYKRCKANKIKALPGLYAEIDVGKPGAPPTQEDALSLLQGNGVDPTMIVGSGGGFHAYWLFKELLVFANNDEREAAAHMNRRLCQFLRDKAAAKGWTVDGVFDLSRVLRPVGSNNCKKSAKVPVTITTNNGPRYQGPEIFDEFLPEFNQPAKPIDITSEIKNLIPTLNFDPDAEPPEEALEILLEDPEFEALWEKKYKRGDDSSPSGWCFELCKVLAEVKVSDQEILDFSIAFRRKHGLSLDMDNRQKYARTIINAKKAVEKPLYTPEEKEILRALRRNQDGDAELYVKQNRGRYVYDHSERQWYLWSDHYWKKDGLKCSLRDIDGVVKVYEPYKNRRSSYRKRVMDLRALTRKKSVLELATIGHTGLGIYGHEWDRNPWLLSCVNGVLDLKTGILSPGKPEQFQRRFSPIAYNPDAPEPLELIQFLTDFYGGNRDKKAMIAYTKRLLGHALIGKQLEHCLIVFYGKNGRNGKGTLFEVITNILRPFVINFGPNFLTSQKFKKNRDDAKPSMIAMKGKRFVLTSETDQDDDYDSSFIKEITGGGTQEGRSLYGAIENFKPSHTVFLATNRRPKANYNDSALWYRMHTIELHRSFVENPKEEYERQRKTDMEDVLMNEAEGILRWMVEGCLEYQKLGSLGKPDEVVENTNKHRMRQDQIRSFIFDCVKKKEGKIYATLFYKAYHSWANENKYSAMTQTMFGRKIKEFIKDDEDNKGIWYMAELK